MSKGKKIILKIIFQSSITLSLIRIWNYNGHRVRTSIGVKKCEFRLDNIPIFAGEIRPGTGCCENSHRCCE